MLRTFDALMRERSVSRAATRLFLSQPAVSASLRRLRDTFDDPLFKRTASGVEPTERALLLAPHVDRILAELAAMVDVGQRFEPATSSRVFRIAGSDFASRVMLPELGTRLAGLGSGIRIFWETGAFDALGERLRKGDVDLAVLPATRTPRDAESTLLYEDRYAFVMRRGHPARGGVPPIEMFCAMPHVVLGHGSSVLDDLIDRALQRRGCRRLIQIAVTSFSQMVDILVDSDHVAVLPMRVALAQADRLEALPLPIEVPVYQLLMCWNPRLTIDPGLEWLKGQIGDIVDRTLAASGASQVTACSTGADSLEPQCAP